MFAQRDFDEVTVAEVATAAGVSSVTVFKYFPRKEDLYFDRAQEFIDHAAAAFDGVGTRTALRAAVETVVRGYAEARHPLSGLDPESLRFYDTVARSVTLTARARQLVDDLQNGIARALRAADYDGPADLAAAFVVAGYSSVFRSTANDLREGVPPEKLVPLHDRRVDTLMEHLATGVA
jgi:AcrR family transcriptional regulator